jgi:hypothetical protein
MYWRNKELFTMSKKDCDMARRENPPHHIVTPAGNGRLVSKISKTTKEMCIPLCLSQFNPFSGTMEWRRVVVVSLVWWRHVVIWLQWLSLWRRRSVGFRKNPALIASPLM